MYLGLANRSQNANRLSVQVSINNRLEIADRANCKWERSDASVTLIFAKRFDKVQYLDRV